MLTCDISLKVGPHVVRVPVKPAHTNGHGRHRGPRRNTRGTCPVITVQGGIKSLSHTPNVRGRGVRSHHVLSSKGVLSSSRFTSSQDGLNRR